MFSVCDYGSPSLKKCKVKASEKKIKATFLCGAFLSKYSEDSYGGNQSKSAKGFISNVVIWGSNVNVHK